MKNARSLVVNLASFCLCLLLFAGVLLSGRLAPIGFSLRYDMIFLAALILAAFIAASRFRNLPLFWSLACFSACLCAAVLSGVWESKVSDLSLMAGIFPVTDSYSYLSGSLELVHSGELCEAASRRPISPALGGILLFVCSGNIRAYLACLVFAVSLAMAWSTSDLVRTHGWPAGFVFYYGLFLFYRRFIGTVLTEHIGLLFGCVAFALLWRSAYRGSKALCVGGQAILAIALCARAGAFFVLPFIALWGGVRWKGVRRFSVSVCLLLCLAAITGFGVNALLARTIGAAERSFGNFSYVLYGLAHGGDWKQVYDDHPEVLDMSESERNAFIYERAFQSVRRRPAALIATSLRAMSAMLLSRDGLYSFVFFANQRVIREWPLDEAAQSLSLPQAIRSDPYKYFHIAATYGMFFFFLLAAGWGCVVIKGSPPVGLLVSTGLGILASAAFAPPWDSDLIRVYAATLPFMLAYPAIGSSRLWHKLLNVPEPVHSAYPWKDNQTVVWLSSVVVVFGVCLLPMLFRVTSEPAASVQQQRLPYKKGIVFLPGANVRLSEPASQAWPWSNISAGELIRRHRGVLSISREDYTDDLLLALESGDALTMAYDCHKRALRYVVYSGRAPEGELDLLPSQRHGLWWASRPSAEKD